MKKAIFSLDKFAGGNHLSSSQLSAIKGGTRRVITDINVKSSNLTDKDDTLNDDGGALLGG